MVDRKSTKDLIAESLFELGERMPFDKISVQEIADNCSISKGTFYYHFRDKYELVAWIYKRNVDTLFRNAVAKGSYRDFQLGCVLETRGRRNSYLNMVENTKGIDSMMLAIQVETFDLLTRFLTERLEEGDLPKRLKFAVNYYTHATSNMIVDWASNDHGLTAEEFTDCLLDCMPPMLKGALERAGLSC